MVALASAVTVNHVDRNFIITVMKEYNANIFANGQQYKTSVNLLDEFKWGGRTRI